MSEWNRNDRDQVMRGRGFEDRERRGDRDQWAGRRDQPEQRSFAEEGPDDWRRREREGRDRMSGGQAAGPQDRGYEGGQVGQGYGPGRGGSQTYEAQTYGSQGYGSAEPEWRRRGNFGDPNDEVRRVTDGETGYSEFFGVGRHQGHHQGMGHHQGLGRHHGEHRGRGPKNYIRADDRIREDVNDRLADDSWLDASEIEVQVSHSEVTLTGTVNNRDDKRRAEDVAEQVSGVKHVQNNLRVHRSRRDLHHSRARRHRLPTGSAGHGRPANGSSVGRVVANSRAATCRVAALCTRDLAWGPMPKIWAAPRCTLGGRFARQVTAESTFPPLLQPGAMEGLAMQVPELERQGAGMRHRRLSALYAIWVRATPR